MLIIIMVPVSVALFLNAKRQIAAESRYCEAMRAHLTRDAVSQSRELGRGHLRLVK